MNINKIHMEIGSLFSKYKIPAITKRMPIGNLHRWSDEVAVHFNLNAENFSAVITELFWSASHIQLSLGYALIARQDSKFPKGKNGKAFKEEDVPNAISIPEIHFWYHIYNSYECIYRCWERITTVLKSVCYPKSKEKMYFDQMANALNKDDAYNKNPHLKALKGQIKHWNKAAKARNEISHGNSSPFRNMSIEGKVSDILGMDGYPIIYCNYIINSPKENIEQVVNKYKKVFPAMEVMVAFIDNIDR